MFVARDAPLAYRLLQRVLWGLLKAIARLDVVGWEQVPRAGPVIVAPNHLHALDIPLVGMAVPRWQAVFAADKWRGKLGGWILERAAPVIYVARGEADREALGRALEVLRRGGALAMAPEGTRSRSGGLIEGKHGVAYAASRTGATIVPVALWGQERALGTWRRLRRPEIHIHIGPPICLPPETARVRMADLQPYTDTLMTTLATMLPP